jgi:hypothetical protein
MIRRLLLTGLMVAAVAPAAAQPMSTMAPRMDSGPNAGAVASGMPTAREHAFARLRATLLELRRQGLALRAADGGTLTPEHLAFIQARLDAAQAAYRPYRSAPR